MVLDPHTHPFLTAPELTDRVVWCLTGVDNQPVGMVRARYDFSARDRKELSLREGDTIKIISKKGPSGWWKGEVYGRVRYILHPYTIHNLLPSVIKKTLLAKAPKTEFRNMSLRGRSGVWHLFKDGYVGSNP
jgi:hypothetical protein